VFGLEGLLAAVELGLVFVGEDSNIQGAPLKTKL